MNGDTATISKVISSGQSGAAYFLCSTEEAAIGALNDKPCKFVLKVFYPDAVDAENEIALLEAMNELKNREITYGGNTWQCFPTLFGSGKCKMKREYVDKTQTNEVSFMVLESLEPNPYDRHMPIHVGEQWLEASGWLAAKGFLQIDSHSGNLLFRDGLPVLIDWGWGVMWKKYSSGLNGTIKNYPYTTTNNYNGREVAYMFLWQWDNMSDTKIGPDRSEKAQSQIWLSVPGGVYILKAAGLLARAKHFAYPQPAKQQPTNFNPVMPGAPGFPLQDPLGLFK